MTFFYDFDYLIYEHFHFYSLQLVTFIKQLFDFVKNVQNILEKPHNDL